MSKPQHSTVTSKLGYKRLARKYAMESLELQNKLKAANERIHQLERENERIKAGNKYAHMVEIK